MLCCYLVNRIDITPGKGYGMILLAFFLAFIQDIGIIKVLFNSR
jgi:hypothetical protein